MPRKLELFLKAQEEAQAQRQQQRSATQNDYGSLDDFKARLAIHTIESVTDPEFKDFYTLYERLFTLDDECETWEGFEAIFALNGDALLYNKYGPYREICMTLRDPKSRALVGGVNMFMYAAENSTTLDGFDGFAQLNYIFVDPAYRGLGLGAHMLALSENRARDYVAKTLDRSSPSLLFFAEQNSPLALTVEDYLKDNMNAMIDQCDRLNWLQSCGYRRVGIPYVQPALHGTGRPPCKNLILCAKLPEDAALSGNMVENYLLRYVGISVNKDDNSGLATDRDWQSMILALRNDAQIGLFDDRAMLARLKTVIHDTILKAENDKNHEKSWKTAIRDLANLADKFW